MKSKDIEALLKQRYILMDDDDRDTINEMMYDSKTGPVIRRFLGGSIGPNIKVPKPKRMSLGKRVTMQPPGFIGGYDPNVAPEKTVADDKPMDARDGDFIINAAAAEFAGKQDIETMINKAITNLQEKGVDVSFGNPKMNIREKVQLLVSQNEVYIPKALAKEIGYDRLEKINNRGKKRTQEVQDQVEQRQARYGGAIKMSEGSVVKADYNTLNSILQFFGLQQGPTESEIREKERAKKVPKRKDQGFALKPPAMPEELRAKKDKELNLFNLASGAVDMSEGGVKTESYIPKFKSGKVIGQSGVTIGRGVDLGQHSAKELRKMGMTEDLMKVFEPFIGLKKEKATAAHKKFNLSYEDAKYASDVMLYKKIDEYNRIFKRFKNVPSERMKAVLVAEHFGGRLGTDDYKLFRDTLIKTGFDLQKAYDVGIFNNPKIKGTVYKNAAKNLLNWYYKDSKPAGTVIEPADENKKGFIVPDVDAQGIPVKRIKT